MEEKANLQGKRRRRGEEEEEKKESMAMNGGEGIHSYSKNSAFQAQVVGKVRGLVEEMVITNLDVEQLSKRRTFRVADMGCSVGPNTFFAVEMIIEAVQKKFLEQGLADHLLPEFHVFFNDRRENDFNTLFRTLPSDKKYYAAGVPGSFTARLFPENFIDLVYSSYSLHWLSEVPKSVLDRHSPAFNKAKIHYGTATKEVADAFETQFYTDMNKFLAARAQEIVPGGMMALTIRGRPDGTSQNQLYENRQLDLLGPCLLEMAEEGTIPGAQVEEFNIPMYFGTSREIESIVMQNGCFDIDKIYQMKHGDHLVVNPSSIELRVALWRAAIGGLLEDHFGEEVIQEMFRRWIKKLEDQSVLDLVTGIGVIVLLKRKHNHINI